MDCGNVRETLHAHLREAFDPEVEAHLTGCPECAAEMRELQSTLSLLSDLPEIEPSPGAWKAIESRLPAPVSPRLKLLAAAGILIAAVSFAAVLLMPKPAEPPVVSATGKVLAWNVPFEAAEFTTLSLPGTGTLKLNQGARVRPLDPRTILLESGEVFAEIEPSGLGFELRCGETTARVRGTRFGMTSPSTVYVVEGCVEVTSPEGRVELRPRQVAVGARLVEVTPDAYVRWLARHERPEIRLRLDPLDRTTITPGSPLKWNLILETDALAPLTLGNPRDVSQFLYLNINGKQVSLDPNTAVVKATRSPDGRVRLDLAHPCVIECAISPRLFRGLRRATVRAVFTSGGNAPGGAWTGTVESQPVLVEVQQNP